MEMIEVVGHRRPYREGGHGGRRLLRDVDGCRGLARWLGSGPLLAAGPWFARRAGGVVEALFCPGVCGAPGSSLHHGRGRSEERRAGKERSCREWTKYLRINRLSAKS